MDREAIRLLKVKHRIACWVCVGHGDVGQGRYCMKCRGTGNVSVTANLSEWQRDMLTLIGEVQRLRAAIALREEPAVEPK